MQEQIKDLDRLLDIQESCEFILKHRPDKKETFFEERILQLAILKTLENIGEAANQISKTTRSNSKPLNGRR